MIILDSIGKETKIIKVPNEKLINVIANNRIKVYFEEKGKFKLEVINHDNFNKLYKKYNSKIDLKHETK